MHHPVITHPSVLKRPFGHEPLRILYAGRLVERQKRVSRLFLLAKELERIGVRCIICIAGDGPDRESLTKAFADADFSFVSVKMFGLVPHERMQNLYSESDVYILTSDYEGSPLSLLEAMSYGLVPIVMDMKSGVREVIIDKKTGFIVNSGDVAAMARRIESLLYRQNLLADMGQAAVEKIRVDHHPQRCWTQLAEAMAVARAYRAPIHIQPVDPFVDPIRGLIASIHRLGIRKVVVYGGGGFGRNMVDDLLYDAISVDLIVDRNKEMHGKFYRGIPFKAVSSLREVANCEAIVIGSLASRTEMVKLAGKIRPDMVILSPIVGGIK